MATSSLFSFAQSLFARLPPTLTPPDWAVSEAQGRLVLLLNHVLMQEPLAMERLARQQGRVVRVQWQDFHFQVRISPAGLLQLERATDTTDLSLTLSAATPWELVAPLLEGAKPEVQVQGDVQLAADINWLIDHVRWDMEADLARIVGDVPAHGLCDIGCQMAQALRRFVPGRAPFAATASAPESQA